MLGLTLISVNTLDHLDQDLWCFISSLCFEIDPLQQRDMTEITTRCLDIVGWYEIGKDTAALPWMDERIRPTRMSAFGT